MGSVRKLARGSNARTYIYILRFFPFFFFFFLLQSTGVLFETNTKQASPYIYPPKKKFPVPKIQIRQPARGSLNSIHQFLPDKHHASKQSSRYRANTSSQSTNPHVINVNIPHVATNVQIVSQHNVRPRAMFRCESRVGLQHGSFPGNSLRFGPPGNP